MDDRDNWTEQNFFLQNAVIPQPNKIEVQKKTSQILLIDSRDRNYTEYPEPSSYSIDLPDDYRDVISLELLNYDIPTQQYTIRKSNSTLHYGITDPHIEEKDGKIKIDYHKKNFYEIEIENGYYDDLDHTVLEGDLQSSLSNLGISNFEVIYNAKTKKFTFKTDFSDSSNSDNVLFFQLFFEGSNNLYMRNSLGPILGFNKKDPDSLLNGYIRTTPGEPRLLDGYQTSFVEKLVEGDWLYIKGIYDNQKYRTRVVRILSDTRIEVDRDLNVAISLCWVGRIEAPWVSNLNPDPYIILKLKGIDTIASTNNNVNRCFMYIPTRKYNFAIRDNLTSIKYFNPIVGRLSKLQITFLNYDGSLYDFNGLNHVLVFQVNRFKQNINYVDTPINESYRYEN
jgi:hypothetical protein